MDVNRRALLKAIASISATSFLAINSGKTNAYGYGGCIKGSGSESNLLKMIKSDPVTLEYKVGSTCCWYCTNKRMVHHYQPVAFIEVIKGAGDSVVGGKSSKLSTVVDRKDDIFFDVRIWELSDYLLDPAFGYQHCKLLGVEEARNQAPKSESQVSSYFGAVCAPTTDLMKLMLDQINEQMDFCSGLKLLYDTSLDTGWDTGCRDILIAGESGPYCATKSLGGGLGSDISNSMSDMMGTTCVGAWGSVYPRQQLYNHTDPRIGSAMAAYRAVSLASDLGLFDFNPIASQIRLQQVTPNTSLGFAPGSMAAEKSLLCPAAVKGRYAYVYWVPVGGCKSVSEIYGFCSPESCTE